MHDSQQQINYLVLKINNAKSTCYKVYLTFKLLKTEEILETLKCCRKNLHVKELKIKFPPLFFIPKRIILHSS